MKKILFVIVLYKQSLHSSQSYKTLLRYMVGRYPIYIYDNSPEPQHRAREFSKFDIYYDGDGVNRGLSYAYNRGAIYAVQRGCDSIMLLDQDTTLHPSIIEEFFDATAKEPHIKLFAPLVIVKGSGYTLSPRGRFGAIPPHRHGELSLWDYQPINSGMIISLDIFWRVGGYNEAVWLDFSDFDFIERIRELDPSLYLLRSTAYQEFSNSVQSREERLERFVIFCRCARASVYSLSLWLRRARTTLRRAISLTLSTRSLKPMTIFTTNFLWQKEL